MKIEIPDNCRVKNGKLEARFQYRGAPYFKYFGDFTSKAADAAETWVLEKKLQAKKGAVPTTSEERLLSLRDAIDVFIEKHVPTLKNEGARKKCVSVLRQIQALEIADQTLDALIYLKWMELWHTQRKKYALSYANKFLIWPHVLYERFMSWNEMVPHVITEKVKLPLKNPVTLAKEQLGDLMSEKGHGRSRVVPDDEIIAAYTWCQAYDPGLWTINENAIISTLRKGDQKAFAGKLVKGFQQKTGGAIELPFTLKAVDMTNRRKRWERLQKAMGWTKRLPDRSINPRHTTEHDLRKIGPTWLGGDAEDKRLIQDLLGHSDPALSKVYDKSGLELKRKAMEKIKNRLALLVGVKVGVDEKDES